MERADPKGPPFSVVLVECPIRKPSNRNGVVQPSGTHLLAVAQVNLAPALGMPPSPSQATNLVATGTSEDALVVHAVAGIALLHAVVIAMRIKREVLRGRLTRPGHDAGTRVATALQAELIGVGHLGERRIVIAGQLGLHHAGRGAQGVLMAVKALSIHNGLVAYAKESV